MNVQNEIASSPLSLFPKEIEKRHSLNRKCGGEWAAEEEEEEEHKEQIKSSLGIEWKRRGGKGQNCRALQSPIPLQFQLLPSFDHHHHHHRTTTSAVLP